MESVSNLTNRSRKSHGRDPSRSPALRRRGAGVDRRPRGVDVVDDADVPRKRLVRDDAPTDVASALLQREPPLTAQSLRASQGIDDGQLPDAPEIGRERSRRHVPSPPSSYRVARDRHEAVRLRARKPLCDKSRCHEREAAATTFLPGAHQPSSPGVVDDRRSCLGECEPPTCALRAPADRPRPWCAAALAHRRDEAGQRGATRDAQPRPGDVAHCTSLGKEQIERPHPPRVRVEVSHPRVRSAPRRAHAGRPVHARGRPAS